MITIDHIEVWNFRSFAHARIDLDQSTGITVFLGRNGAGKSTLVKDSLRWALFGETPAGTTVKDLRKEGSTGEVRVEIGATIKGEPVTVTRALRGSKDTTVASIESPHHLEPLAASASAAVAWITQRLGMDSASFEAAMVKTHDTVTGLLTLTPSKRRELVERLANATPLLLSVEQARQSATAAIKTRDAFPPTLAADTDHAHQQVRDAENALNAQQAHIDDLQAALEQHRCQADDASTRLKQTLAHYTHAQRLARELEQARHQSALLHGQAQAAADHANELQSQAPDPAEISQLHHTIADHQRQRQRLQVTIDTALQAATATHAAQEQLRTVQQIEATAAQDEQHAQQQLDAHSHEHDSGPDIDQRIQELRDHVSTSEQHLGALRSEHDRINKAITELTEHTDTSTCPTCRQHLTNPDELISDLRNQLADVLVAGTQARTSHSQTQHDLDAALHEREQIAVISARRAEATTRLNEARQRHHRARKHVSDLMTRLEGLASELHTANQQAHAARKQVNELDQTIATCQAKLSELDTDTQRYEHYQRKLSQADQLRHEAQSADDAVAGLHHQMDQLTAVDETEVDNARAAEAAASHQVVRAEGELRVATAELTHLRTALDTAERAHAHLNNELQRFHHAQRHVELSTATATGLEKYRADWLAKLATHLSDMASDLVTQMTDAQFIAVALDENFTATVTTCEGQQRPATQLSAGESTIVAMALALAIGDVIAGATVGVLIADEVAALLDAQWRPAFFDALRRLPNRQVLTMLHSGDVTDFADHVYMVTSGPEGSTVEAVAATDGTWVADLSSVA